MFFIVICICVFSPLRTYPVGNQVRTIVIDAGHGGSDPGAPARPVNGIVEKKITLKVALKLGELIEKELPGVKVIYTRKTDVFIDVWKRGQIANDAKADLFVSIHCNAAGSSSAHGTETYVMGTDKAGANLETVLQENSVILLEEDYTTKYSGYIPGDPDSYMIFSLMQYAYQEQSMILSDMVQKHFTKNTSWTNRGTKSGNLMVLWKTTMPSILTEIGFISNPTERAFMNSEKGQNTIARSLFDAIAEYKKKVEDGVDPSAAAPKPADRVVPVTVPAASVSSQNSDLTFRIQVAAGTRKMSTSSQAQFGEYRNRVTEIRSGGMYRYYVEETGSYSQATTYQRQARKKFKDAFIVAFRNGERVTITDEMKKN